MAAFCVCNFKDATFNLGRCCIANRNILIGLRKIDTQNCEMKRLYVRPSFRGKKIGGFLVEKIIADAREIGYTYMLLDTLPFLESACAIYQKAGFYEIPSYNDSPMDASIFMKLDL